MCTGAEIGMLAMSAAGLATNAVPTIMGMNQQHQAQNAGVENQIAALKAATERSKIFDDDRQKLLDKNINQYSSQNQVDDYNALAEQKGNQAVSDLQKGIDTIDTESTKGSENIGGAVSSAYKTELAKNRADVLRDSINRAKLFGRAMAPNALGAQNTVMGAEYTNAANVINAAQKRQGGIDQTEIQYSGLPNYNQYAIGSALRGVGQSGIVGRAASRAASAVIQPKSQPTV